MSWRRSIELSKCLVAGKGQAEVVVMVSGSRQDVDYWVRSVREVERVILAEEGGPELMGVAEQVPAGNYFGTIRAWDAAARQGRTLPATGVSLMCMVFGQGTRLSPFTQALGGRKSALRTPYWAPAAGRYLRTIDLAILYSSLWMDELRERGFAGVVVKWGDEATLPGLSWNEGRQDFREIDMVRFLWKTEPNEVYAREKEWFVIDNQSGLVVRLIPRQPLESLCAALQPYAGSRYSLAVNLGSVALTYELLSLSREVLQPILDGSTADWDPFVTYLLLGGNERDSDPYVQEGLRKTELRAPGIVAGIRSLRDRWRSMKGRDLRTGHLDFGDAFWIDLGLHETLRRALEGMHESGERGEALRAFFAVPEDADVNGNRVVGDRLAPGANIRDTILVNTRLSDQTSAVKGGLFAGCRLGRAEAPHGGTALFCCGGNLTFRGRHAVAYEWTGAQAELAEGERRTTLRLPHGRIDLTSNESIQKYDEATMTRLIDQNAMSFREAGDLMQSRDPRALEQEWEEEMKRSCGWS